MKKTCLLLVLSIFLFSGCSRIQNCKNCVYSFYLDTKILSDGTAVEYEGLKPTVISEYTYNYEDIKTNVFLGNVLDKNGTIKKAYVCAKNNNKAFCVNSNDRPNLYKIFGKGNCIDYEYGIKCNDEVNVTVSNELVNIYDGSYTCSVDYIRGSSSCNKTTYNY